LFFPSGGCSVIGAILIVIGLYSVLWGKHKEQIESKVGDEIPLKGAQSSVIAGLNDFSEEKCGEKGESNNNKPSSVVITMPVREPITKDNQEGKA